MKRYKQATIKTYDWQRVKFNDKYILVPYIQFCKILYIKNNAKKYNNRHLSISYYLVSFFPLLHFNGFVSIITNDWKIE